MAGRQLELLIYGEQGHSPFQDEGKLIRQPGARLLAAAGSGSHSQLEREECTAGRPLSEQLDDGL